MMNTIIKVKENRGAYNPERLYEELNNLAYMLDYIIHFDKTWNDLSSQLKGNADDWNIEYKMECLIERKEYFIRRIEHLRKLFNQNYNDIKPSISELIDIKHYNRIKLNIF